MKAKLWCVVLAAGFVSSVIFGALLSGCGSDSGSGPAPTIVPVKSVGDKFLYISTFSETGVAGFLNGQNETFTTIAGSPFTAGTDPAGMADPGNFLFVADFGASAVLAFHHQPIDRSVDTGGGFTVSGRGTSFFHRGDS
jgi:hypothetical protein